MTETSANRPAQTLCQPGSDRRSVLVAAVILLVASLVTFGPLVAHPTDLLVGTHRAGRNDLTQAFLAYRALPAQIGGRFVQWPLWHPYSMGGRPWYGNPQAALFYPPNWLAAWSEAPALWGWLLVVHHLWAGGGVYVLARQYGAGGGAVLGALAFLAAPYLVAHTAEGHLNQVFLIAHIPWVLWCYERLREGRRMAGAALAVLLSACVFCGHIQELLYLSLLMSAYFLWDMLGCLRQHQRGQAARLALRYAAATALALAVSAVELLPGWLYAKQSIRGGVAGEELARFSAGWANLRQLANPAALGWPVDYQGPGTFYWESLCYFGIVPLVLAVLAVLFVRGRPIGRWAATAGIGLVFALGPATPVYGILERVLPPIGWFRVPGRALFFVSLAVALLAAFGCEWCRERVRAWQATGFPLSAASGKAPRLWSRLCFTIGMPRTDTPIRWETRLGTWSWDRLLGAALSLACLAELGWHAWNVLATIPASVIRSDSAVVRDLVPRAETWRILASQSVLSDREAWRAGLHKFPSYEPVPLTTTAVVFETACPTKSPIMSLMGFAPVRLKDYHRPALDWMGVRYAVVPVFPGDPPAGWKLLGWHVIPDEFTLRGQTAPRFRVGIFENTEVLPRAFVVGQARRAASPALWKDALRSLDPRREILLDQDPLPAGPRATFRPATILRHTASLVEVDAELDAPGYLYLSDTWYPGWRAEAGGQRLPVLRANVAFRAVPLPAGRHRVVFHYRPALGGLAAGLSLAAWVLVVGWVSRDVQRGHRRTAAEEEEHGSSSL